MAVSVLTEIFFGAHSLLALTDIQHDVFGTGSGDVDGNVVQFIC